MNLPGYGIVPVPRKEWGTPVEPQSLMDQLLIWEEPRRTERYTLGVDVGDGIGLDRSVCSVLRQGTLKEPDEEVAQFVTDSIDPTDFAGVIDAIGRYYSDGEGTEAMAAIEVNNVGASTQSQLQRHYGYGHFYIWQYLDAADPRRRYSTKMGWWTTRRTRPFLVTHFAKSIKSIISHDSGKPVRAATPDLILNSPFTLAELADFQAPNNYLALAEAAAGAHDDAIFATAIAAYVISQQHLDQGEPLADQRLRLQEEAEKRAEQDSRLGQRRDFQNSDCTVETMNEALTDVSWG